MQKINFNFNKYLVIQSYMTCYSSFLDSFLTNVPVTNYLVQCSRMFNNLVGVSSGGESKQTKLKEMLFELLLES